MSLPQVPIDVDQHTGVWTTNGMPMIYLPRHFYLNHLDAFQKAMGQERFNAVLDEAGARSAREWCMSEAATHRLRGLDVFQHYMRRISQRGWGQFSILSMDEKTGEGVVRLDHSVFVLHKRQTKTTQLVCGAFSSWFVGALEWAGRDLGRLWSLTAAETRCAAMKEHDHCLFEIGTSGATRGTLAGSTPLNRGPA
jgi:Domain of unknown function (DUF5943)